MNLRFRESSPQIVTLDGTIKEMCQGRVKGEEWGRTQEKISADIRQGPHEEQKKMWQAALKQETNKRCESGVDQAWAHIDQADGSGGHLEVVGCPTR